MDKLIRIVLTLLTEMQVAQRVSRVSGAAKWLVLAGVCGLGAGAALIAALWLFLIPRIGSDAAALSIGVLLAVLSGLFILIARATLNAGSRQPLQQQDDDPLAEIRELFGRNKGAALLSAVIAGLAMGNGRK